MSSQAPPSPSLETADIPLRPAARTDSPTSSEEEHPDYARIRQFATDVRNFDNYYTLTGSDRNLEAIERLLDVAVGIYFPTLSLIKISLF